MRCLKKEQVQSLFSAEFQILITLSTFISSRLLTPFASLSIQIKPVKYLAGVSYFTFFLISLSLGESYLSQTKIWSFIRTIILAPVLVRESIAVFIHTSVLLEVSKCVLFVSC